ncbi:MAG: hypothetical protein DA407_15265 [Bacteroidetes bacterium]|nr:MAG: hypothetical protein DA407_15265 [Bacteroidota bacterium]
MKKLGLIILLGMFFSVGFAQQQLNQIQRGQRGYTPPIIYNNETYIELVDPFDEVDKMIPKCVAVLKLDAFEQEIIKGMLIKKFESQNAILENEKNTRADRKKKIDDLDKEYWKELATILKPDEIEKYKAIDFTETNKEKKKRRKKN